MLFIFASIGLPGTSGFVGEFLALVGTFDIDPNMTILATLGVVLGAVYSLSLYRRVVFGTPRKAWKNVVRLKWSESLSLLMAAVMTILLGVYPQPVIHIMHKPLEKLSETYMGDLHFQEHAHHDHTFGDELDEEEVSE